MKGTVQVVPSLRAKLATAVFWGGLFLSCRGSDWPQWRGPERDGVWPEPGIPLAFPAAGLKPRWTAPVGFGFSTPVVASGRVFVTDSYLRQPKVIGRVQCFSEKSGALLWTFAREFDFPEWAFKPGQEPMPNGTPVAAGGRLYALGPNGRHVFCLDQKEGRLLWEKNLAAEYHIDETTAVSYSPLVDGNRVFLLPGVPTGPAVVALDCKDGREIWRALEEGTAQSSPVLIRSGGVRQLIVWTLKSVASLDPATGRPRWIERVPGSPSGVIPTPVFSGDRLLVGGLMFKLAGKKPGAIRLWPENPSKTALAGISTPLLTAEAAFGLSKSATLVCLDRDTGSVIWENEKAAEKASGSSAAIHLTLNQGTVFLFTDQGDLIRARLSIHGYEEISRARLVTPTYGFGGRKVAWAAPAFANGCIFARTDQLLVCIPLK